MSFTVELDLHERAKVKLSGYNGGKAFGADVYDLASGLFVYVNNEFGSDKRHTIGLAIFRGNGFAAASKDDHARLAGPDLNYNCALLEKLSAHFAISIDVAVYRRGDGFFKFRDEAGGIGFDDFAG